MGSVGPHTRAASSRRGIPIHAPELSLPQAHPGFTVPVNVDPRIPTQQHLPITSATVTTEDIRRRQQEELQKSITLVFWHKVWMIHRNFDVF